MYPKRHSSEKSQTGISQVSRERPAPLASKLATSWYPSGAKYGLAKSMHPCGRVRPQLRGRVELNTPGKASTVGSFDRCSSAFRMALQASRNVWMFSSQTSLKPSEWKTAASSQNEKEAALSCFHRRSLRNFRIVDQLPVPPVHVFGHSTAGVLGFHLYCDIGYPTTIVDTTLGIVLGENIWKLWHRFRRLNVRFLSGQQRM